VVFTKEKGNYNEWNVSLIFANNINLFFFFYLKIINKLLTYIYILILQKKKKKKNSFLGYINLKGTTYQSETIATGYGAYIAQPLLRNAVEKKNGEPLTEEEAKKLLDDCMRVLFYRDARSLNKVHNLIL